MASMLTDQTAQRVSGKKSLSDEKPVSLSVNPGGPDSPDIQVEVKRNPSAHRRKRQRRFAAFLVSVLFLLLFPMFRDGFSMIQMYGQLQQIQERNQELRGIQQELEQERDGLHTPEVIERVAREELDMVLPNESKVYSAVPTDDMPERERLITGEVLH